MEHENLIDFDTTYNIEDFENFEDEDLLELRKVINLTLLKLGLKCDHFGFNYFSTAVELAVTKPYEIDRRNLLRTLQEAYHVDTIHSIERCMRGAVDLIYLSGTLEKFCTLFPSPIFDITTKPSIYAMVQMLADYCISGVYKNYINI